MIKFLSKAQRLVRLALGLVLLVSAPAGADELSGRLADQRDAAYGFVQDLYARVAGRTGTTGGLLELEQELNGFVRDGSVFHIRQTISADGRIPRSQNEVLGKAAFVTRAINMHRLIRGKGAYQFRPLSVQIDPARPGLRLRSVFYTSINSGQARGQIRHITESCLYDLQTDAGGKLEITGGKCEQGVQMTSSPLLQIMPH